MAVTAVLIFSGHNNLRYLVTQDGGGGTSVTITTTGAASPDLLTDSVQGPIKKIAKAFTDGYGAVVAGVLTQAQSRMLWLSDLSGATGLAPAPGLPTITTQMTPVTPTVAVTPAIVDANVDGGGHPTLVVTCPAAASAFHLDVMLPNAIGA